jgi:hypothetical protein
MFLLEAIQNAVRDGMDVFIGIFAKVVDAAVAGMRLATIGENGENTLGINTRCNMVSMTGTLVWDENTSRYTMEGDGVLDNVQTKSISCHDMTYVHAFLAVNVDPLQNLYATVSRHGDMLTLRIVCTQDHQTMLRCETNTTKKFTTIFRVIVSDSSHYIGTDAQYNGYQHTKRLTCPVPADGMTKMLVLSPDEHIYTTQGESSAADEGDDTTAAPDESSD